VTASFLKPGLMISQTENCLTVKEVKNLSMTILMMVVVVIIWVWG